MSSPHARALAALRSARHLAPTRHALVGLDGFVDTIVVPVGNRRGQGTDFDAIKTLTEFAARIAAAAGKSTNIELYPERVKLGGNGPIFAAALLAGGTRLTYVGALGADGPHPVFQDFARRADVVSLCDPGATTAIEFSDGKLMLGQLCSLDTVTLARIDEVMGAARFRAALADADLVGLVNWTMIPNMSAIFADLLDHVLPALPPRPATAPRRGFFFDLADPEKRPREDLRTALGLIARFQAFGDVCLGLNLKEAQQVCGVLGLAEPDKDEASLRAACVALRERLAVACVVVHPRESAACATAAGSAWVPGPYCENPVITTGAGDHFNSGFVQGQLLGLDPESCLVMGVSTSGHYVRTAVSPTLDDLETFLANRL